MNSCVLCDKGSSFPGRLMGQLPSCTAGQLVKFPVKPCEFRSSLWADLTLIRDHDQDMGTWNIGLFADTGVCLHLHHWVSKVGSCWTEGLSFPSLHWGLCPVVGLQCLDPLRQSYRIIACWSSLNGLLKRSKHFSVPWRIPWIQTRSKDLMGFY